MSNGFYSSWSEISGIDRLIPQSQIEKWKISTTHLFEKGYKYDRVGKFRVEVLGEFDLTSPTHTS
ncbi:hypothetical protein QUB50_10215 [Microcoleus sp. A6-C5]